MMKSKEEIIEELFQQANAADDHGSQMVVDPRAILTLYEEYYKLKNK